jgi:hypothetical protein
VTFDAPIITVSAGTSASTSAAPVPTATTGRGAPWQATWIPGASARTIAERVFVVPVRPRRTPATGEAIAPHRPALTATWDATAGGKPTTMTR